MEYDIKITEKSGALGAIAAAIKVAKCLNLELIFVDFQAGFSLGVNKDSQTNDIYEIYRLTLENQKLKKQQQK